MTVIRLSTRGTVCSDCWAMQSTELLELRIYYLGDHGWTPLSQNPHWPHSATGFSCRYRMSQRSWILDRIFTFLYFRTLDQNELDLTCLRFLDPGWTIWTHPGTVRVDSCPHTTIRWGWSRALRFGWCFFVHFGEVLGGLTNDYKNVINAESPNHGGHSC